MKKILFSALVLFLFGTLTTQAALVNVSTIYDTVANTLSQVRNAATASFQASSFTATSTTATSTFAGYVPTKGNELQYRLFVTVGTSSADYITDGTDDQVEINNALTFARLNNLTLYIKEGTYSSSSPIEAR